MYQSYDAKRTHKVNLIMTYGIVIFFLVGKIFTMEMDGVIRNLLYTLPVLIIASALYPLKINDTLKGYLYGSIPTVVVFALLMLDRFTVDKHYIIFVTVTMIALYFNKKLILIYGVTVNILFLISFLVNPEHLLSVDNNGLFNAFSSTLVMFNSALIALYLLARWGNASIQSSIEKSVENQKVLASLKSTHSEIEESTLSIGRNMTEMNSHSQTTSELSKQVALSMQEISQGTQELAISVSNINHEMDEMTTDISDTKDMPMIYLLAITP